jgi:hypothetical protein
MNNSTRHKDHTTTALEERWEGKQSCWFLSSSLLFCGLGFFSGAKKKTEADARLIFPIKLNSMSFISGFGR